MKLMAILLFLSGFSSFAMAVDPIGPPPMPKLYTHELPVETYFVGANCAGFTKRGTGLQRQYTLRLLREKICGNETFAVMLMDGSPVAFAKRDLIELN